MEVDLNTAYIDDEDAYVTDYEEAAGQEEYTEYDTPSGRVICACR